MTSKFGVEIEYVGFGGDRTSAVAALNGDGYTVVNENWNRYITRDFWKVVSEPSVYRGGELISPPLPYTSDGLEHFGGMMRRLRDNGANMSASCGMHVHVDASFLAGLERTMIRNFFEYLLSAYRQNEHLFDRFVKRNRRGDVNHYCKSLVGRDMYHFDYDREHKLNIQAYSKHGTIEFRHYHGTLNDEAAKAWVILCVTFLTNVRNEYFRKNNLELPQESATVAA